MSDTLQEIQVNTGGKTIILYNNRKPDAYGIEDIYDPENPQSGKYFPSLYSLVVDTTGRLYYVSARDTANYSVTLTPCSYISTEEENEVTIISYGNDKFCLYIDTRTDPHRLVVDAKFLVYGNNLVEYALYKTDLSGEEQCISQYYDAAGNFVSNRIPLQSISESYPSYKFPTNCHTTFDLVEGDPVVLRAYNNIGNLSAEITLYVRNAQWLNDLASHTNPIVSLNAEALQMMGDDLFLYEKQDVSHLNIQPYLLYVDGSRQNVNVDNQRCFIYGLDDVETSYPGRSQTIIIKYFLNYKETTTVSTSDERRFLTCTKKIVVVDNKNDYTVKLSCIPIWSSTYNQWQLYWFAYTDDRQGVYDVTALVRYNESYPFDGTSASFGKEQRVVVEYDLQSIFQTDDPITGVQTLYLTLWDNQKYERYTFRDNKDDTFIYGVDGSITRRPVIHYDETIDQYFIPTSIFENVDAVIESFYTLARPPYNPAVETVAPTPTHFTVRDAQNGRQIIGGPIPLTEYGQCWPTIVGVTIQPGQTVLVEFLYQDSDNSYAILYGVPVDVYAGTFNTENAGTDHIEP